MINCYEISDGYTPSSLESAINTLVDQERLQMAECIYCRKSNISATHECRTMRAQKKLEPFENDLIQWLMVERRSIYGLQTTGMQWAGQKISGDWLRDWCRIRGVKTLSMKDAANLPETRQKYKDTVRTIYGVDNVSQSQQVKDRKLSVNRERYGVDNPFQRPEVISKIKDTLLDKYGVTNPRHLPMWSGRNMLSTPHRKISTWLTSVGIKHENEKPNLFPKPVATNNRIYSPIVDIWIESHNTVIEIYGNYWHANPNIYYASDVIHLFIGPTTAQEIWDIDRLRQSHIESFGVRMIVVWEDDIKKSFDTITSMLYDIFSRKMAGYEKIDSNI